jgi:hypothetical protein
MVEEILGLVRGIARSEARQQYDKVLSGPLESLRSASTLLSAIKAEELLSLMNQLGRQKDLSSKLDPKAGSAGMLESALQFIDDEKKMTEDKAEGAESD